MADVKSDGSGDSSAGSSESRPKTRVIGGRSGSPSASRRTYSPSSRKPAEEDASSSVKQEQPEQQEIISPTSSEPRVQRPRSLPTRYRRLSGAHKPSSRATGATSVKEEGSENPAPVPASVSVSVPATSPSDAEDLQRRLLAANLTRDHLAALANPAMLAALSAGMPLTPDKAAAMAASLGAVGAQPASPAASAAAGLAAAAQGTQPIMASQLAQLGAPAMANPMDPIALYLQVARMQGLASLASMSGALFGGLTAPSTSSVAAAPAAAPSNGNATAAMAVDEASRKRPRPAGLGLGDPAAQRLRTDAGFSPTASGPLRTMASRIVQEEGGRGRSSPFRDSSPFRGDLEPENMEPVRPPEENLQSLVPSPFESRYSAPGPAAPAPDMPALPPIKFDDFS